MIRSLIFILFISAFFSCKSTKTTDTVESSHVKSTIKANKSPNSKLIIVIDNSANNKVLESDFSKYNLKFKKPMSRKEAKGLYAFDLEKISQKKIIEKLLKKDYVLSATGLHHDVQHKLMSKSGKVKESKPVR